ncbi:MAG: long-chain fatty acid--CoA ligase [Promethearchaeota archaeon]
MTLRQLIEERSKLGDKVWMINAPDGREWTYADLGRVTNKIGHLLAGLGVEKGDKVSLLLPNVPEFVFFYLGVPKMGAVVGPVNALFKGRGVQFVVNHAESKVLVTTPQFMPIVEQIRDDLPLVKEIVLVGDEEEVEKWPGAKSFSRLFEAAPDESLPDPGITDDDVAAILYTSGTTGFPKGVLQTHGNIVANGRQCAEALPSSPDFRYMLILPLFHVNGQIVTVITPLTVGATTVLTPGFSATKHWEIVEKYRCSTFSAVPTILTVLSQVPIREGADLSSLKFVICGAAPLSVETLKQFEAKFPSAKVVEGYGLTEGTCASSVNPFPTETEDRRKIGSIGLPLPDQEILIVDKDGNPLPPRQLGEIVIRGPNVMKGYFKNPEANAETLKPVKGHEGMWLYTGDVGFLDEDGFLYIRDRIKDMIIRGGENIYPKEVEEVLYTFPGVSLAAVVGVPDEKYGEEVKAYLVMKEGVPRPSAEEVIAFCKQHLADFQCPRYVEFRDSLPLTATGKISKKDLREEAAAR